MGHFWGLRYLDGVERRVRCGVGAAMGAGGMKGWGTGTRGCWGASGGCGGLGWVEG